MRSGTLFPLRCLAFSVLFLQQGVIQAHPGSPCANRSLFSLQSESDYESVSRDFLSVGGRVDDIVQVDSVDTIVDSFGAYKFLEDFEYRKKTRNQFAYKFAVSKECQLNASFYEYKYRKDKLYHDIHHHLVAKGDEVYTAGAIYFFHDGKEVEKVVLSNRSSRFCPSFESLTVAKGVLISMGIEEEKILLVEDDNCS